MLLFNNLKQKNYGVNYIVKFLYSMFRLKIIREPKHTKRISAIALYVHEAGDARWADGGGGGAGKFEIRGVK